MMDELEMQRLRRRFFAEQIEAVLLEARRAAGWCCR